jgi:ubiquinol-cytochrome c reductase iron-sulfur subunit
MDGPRDNHCASGQGGDQSVSESSSSAAGPRRESDNPAQSKEIERVQELLDTRFMADIGPVKEGYGRRQFLNISVIAASFAGLNFFVWPFVQSMNPAADVEALASTEVDLSPIEQGQSVTVVWRGKPVFVRHRTEAEIASARAGDADTLPDPATDAERAERPEWLVVVGICTHLGCVPRGQRSTDPRGDYGGWFCSCHGAQYDTAGRIRRGPAPTNLDIPPYTFVSDTVIRIG